MAWQTKKSRCVATKTQSSWSQPTRGGGDAGGRFYRSLKRCVDRWLRAAAARLSDESELP